MTYDDLKQVVGEIERQLAPFDAENIIFSISPEQFKEVGGDVDGEIVIGSVIVRMSTP